MSTDTTEGEEEEGGGEKQDREDEGVEEEGVAGTGSASPKRQSVAESMLDPETNTFVLPAILPEGGKRVEMVADGEYWKSAAKGDVKSRPFADNDRVAVVTVVVEKEGGEAQVMEVEDRRVALETLSPNLQESAEEEGKEEPEMVTTVPPVAGPEAGEKEVGARGGVLVKTAAEEGKFWLLLDTETLYAEAGSAGAVQMAEVDDMYVGDVTVEATEESVVLVNLQANESAGRKFVPTTVTWVPPASDPVEGRRAVTEISAWYVKVVPKDVKSLPLLSEISRVVRAATSEGAEAHVISLEET
jgi:hypothetical protein